MPGQEGAAKGFAWKKKRTLIQASPLDPQESEPEPAQKLPRLERPALVPLEDPDTRFKRLKAEGIQLVEGEKPWQAIYNFDHALEIRPEDVGVLDMKAQALMSLHEWDPAIETCLKVLKLQPNWADAYQTLGRAYLGCGKVPEARKSFLRALHLQPDFTEVIEEDLPFAQRLYNHVRAEQEAEKQQQGEDHAEKDAGSGEQEEKQ